MEILNIEMPVMCQFQFVPSKLSLYDAFCGGLMPIFTSVLCTEGNFQVVCTITLCIF